MTDSTEVTQTTSDSISPEFDPKRPIQSGVSMLKAVLLSPRKFFIGFSEDGPIKGPILFVMLVTAVTATLQLALTLTFGSNDAASVGISTLEAIAFVLMSPLLVAIFAGTYLLSIRTFVGPVGTFRGTYRMLAYAYGAMVLFWIPVLKAFAFAYATLVLMVICIHYVHRTTLLNALITALVAYVPIAVGFIWLQFYITGLAFG
jgi:hypothetical protein